ncbi:DUF2520 domain-containing protein [Paludibacter sp.]
MRIIIIGVGNLATHLSLALQSAGNEIVQVYSRTIDSASSLAAKLDVPFTNQVSEINPNADLYIYALSDDVLESFVQNSIAPDAIHVHTAGSVSIDIFKNYKENYGVFYPLQTFSKIKPVDFSNIPLFIEASNDAALQKLSKLATSISKNVYQINSEQRLKLHIAGVFANNFVNHLYKLASDIATSADIPFDAIKPLIMETAEKIQILRPEESQTGPAKRNDLKVLEKHRELLKNDDEILKLYNQLSDMILKSYQG